MSDPAVVPTPIERDVGQGLSAYQGRLPSAWAWLPVSAITEMSAVTVFALNLGITFLKKPPFPRMAGIGAENSTTAASSKGFLHGL